jgi:hypothetical protein
LNTGECIKRPLTGLRASAEDQYSRVMIRITGDVPHREHETESGVIVRRVDHASPGSGAGHRAVFDDPTCSDAPDEFGGVRVFQKELVQPRRLDCRKILAD